jgi:hypothetical protein
MKAAPEGQRLMLSDKPLAFRAKLDTGMGIALGG